MPLTNQPLRILVVDDEPAICRALTITFERAGYAVFHAISSASALELLAREHIDVLVADFRIPDGRGDVLYHYASAMQPHLREQTLIVTGDVSDRVEMLIDSCGCPYLRKPFFSLADIVDAVRALAPRREDSIRRA